MRCNRTFKIGDREVGQECPVFIIAEAGVNHNGDVKLGKQLVDAAVEAKADAVKFQTFKAHKLNTRTAPKSSYHLRTTPKDEDQSWFELLRSQEISPDMHRELISYCSEKGIIFLSTPYDPESADLLESLDIKAYKVASTDTNNYPLLSHLGKKKRPIILSTAMCSLDEVCMGIKTIYNTGNRDLMLLHCTANYPCALENTNMLAMKTLESEFDITVGYSDHSRERINPILAVGLGAKIIEKHFTVSRDLPGPDHQASLLADELTQMVKDIRGAESAMGTGVKAPLPCEEENILKLRKSVVVARDIHAGEILNEGNLDIKRPGTGEPPEAYERFLGKKAKRDLPADHILTFNDIQ